MSEALAPSRPGPRRWARELWERGALRSHTVRRVLQKLGVDLTLFEREYRDEGRRTRSAASLKRLR